MDELCSEASASLVRKASHSPLQHWWTIHRRLLTYSNKVGSLWPSKGSQVPLFSLGSVDFLLKFQGTGDRESPYGPSQTWAQQLQAFYKHTQSGTLPVAVHVLGVRSFPTFVKAAFPPVSTAFILSFILPAQTFFDGVP